MKAYVIDENFLINLGFKDFNSIENKETNSYWTRDFIQEEVLNITKNLDLKKTEKELNTTINNVMDRLTEIDYSSINEDISMIINEEL